MENSLSIYGINGPLVTVKGKTDLKMSEMVYVGKEKLVGEVIRLSPELATIQVFEETSGLKPGELLYPTGATLSVTLAPGIVSNIFDGIERPLAEIEKNPVNISTEVSLWILWILTGNGRRSCV